MFHEVAEEVAEVLARQRDWGASGGRTGQYAVDLAADASCSELLLGRGYRVLSEESGVQGPEDAPMVVVDPLDGSTNASRGIPWYATTLCLVDPDGPAVSMVANHATGQRHWAVRGEGARSDDGAIAVSGCAEVPDSLVGISGLPDRDYGWAQFRALGAAAPDICAVADGTLDAWVDMSVDAHGVWDYLAAVAICREAGGVAVDAMGRDLVTLDHGARRTPVVAATEALLDVLATRRRGP